MSIRKLLAVARREYAETVKTKAFLLGILIMPVLIVGLIFLSAKLSADEVRSPSSALRVAVIDHSGRVAKAMSALAAQRSQDGDQQGLVITTVPPEEAESQQAALKRRVLEGGLFCILEIPVEAPAGEGTCQLSIGGTGMDRRSWTVRNLLNEAIKRLRFADAGLDVQRVETLSKPIAINELNVRGEAGQGSPGMAGMFTPFAFLFLLFMGVFGVSQGLLTSVIEEKSSRVVEVLLSALSPFELMAGKILGMAGVGLTMVTLWALVGYATAMVKHVEHLVRLTNLGQFVMYYVLGFLLISSILAAVGSACNTIKEAQPIMSPLTLMLVIPMMLWFQIARSPNSVMATVLSLLPPVTPFVMMLRLTSLEGTVPLWQQVAAPLWVAAWVLATMWAASRVFRVGLLMYGKPPGLRELARWVTYK